MGQSAKKQQTESLQAGEQIDGQEESPAVRLRVLRADEAAGTVAVESQPPSSPTPGAPPASKPAGEGGKPIAVRQPTPELLEELARESQRLETATPQDILAWGIERFAPKFAMATAFGPEGMTIIHMLSQVAPQTSVFNLDTGYQFKETLELREEVNRKYGIEVELKRPELSVQEYEKLNGGPVHSHDPARCCGDRKLKVLREASLEYDAWASAIRRDQSPDRAKAPIVGWDKKFGLVKVSPLANWTKQQVWKLIGDENIPYNPLHDQGYMSVGCFPCTRSTLPGEDERAGRWSGFAKTECGLHSSD